MSLKANTLSNYVSQAYATLIGILVYPLYLKYMGSEAYGLVGFLTTLQIWLNLLDAGMSPTFGRQVSDYRGKNTDFRELKAVLRSIEFIIIVGSAVIFLTSFFASDWLTVKWLHVKSLNVEDVKFCLVIMSLIIVARWLSALYKSGVSGLEEQVWLSKINIFISTLRAFGALALLKWLAATYIQFFEFQLFTSVLELLFCCGKFYSFLRETKSAVKLFSFAVIKPLLPIAGSLSLAVIVWVFISQLDRLLLSNILPLKEYGYFSVVATVTGGILQASGPLGLALLPRMTWLLSSGRKEDMLKIYEKGSQFLAVVLMPSMAICSVFGPEVLNLWVNSPELTAWAAPLMKWYVWGNGLSVMMGVLYLLQFAYGDLRLHVAGTTIITVLAAPCIAYCAYEYQAMGTALCWFGVNFLVFLIWPYIVHRKFAPAFATTWYKDLFITLAFSMTPVLILKYLGPNVFAMKRFDGVVYVLAIGVLTQLLVVLSNKYCRKILVNFFRQRLRVTAA